MKLFWSLYLLAVCCGSVTAQTGNEPKNITQLYGKQALPIIQNPNKVYTVLLSDQNGRVSERSTRVPLPPEVQLKASKLLSANSSYDWEVWKPCLPRYGSRLIFNRGTRSVSVDFCFDCLILSVTPATHAGYNVDFSPSRDVWLRLFKDQFPKDEVFKALQ